jgi:Flp pilus assembly protein TadD
VLKTDPGYMNSYGRLGEAYFGLGRYGDATRVYREAVRRNPGDPAIRYNLAVSYVMLKRYEEARALMEPLTAEIPRSYELRYSLAGTYEKLGMGERALEQARLALDMAGDDEEKGSAALLVTRLRAK